VPGASSFEPEGLELDRVSHGQGDVLSSIIASEQVEVRLILSKLESQRCILSGFDGVGRGERAERSAKTTESVAVVDD
jgi:hypothetical protein